MMAQEVYIAGALFSDVPSISVPDHEGNFHAFTDTSDANATASDIASGKTAYVAGQKVTGIASGGGTTPTGTISITTNGTHDVTSYATAEVNVSGGVTPSGSMSDPIRFFDYDGTLVASYSSVPSVLPAVPTHTGLKSGAWNYTLQQLTTQFNATGRCDVGANYETVSGATEIDVTFESDERLSPYLRFAVKGTVTVDWGDGSSTEDVTGTSLTTRKSIQHTYSSAGSYTIKLTPASGTTYAMFGTGSYFLLYKSGTANENRLYANCVRAVRLGSGCSIGDYAFVYCSMLKYVSIPSSVTSIENNAFDHCYALAFAVIPSGVTSIEGGAFTSCYSLTSISIPSSVTSIGNSAFTSCYSLTSIAIPSGVTSIGNSVLSSCYSLTSIAIPSSVTSIGNSAFSNCYSLPSIAIPSSVTSIGNSVLSSCYSLACISIPSSVTSIGNSAFASCYSLPSIVIPSGVTSIGNSAFSNCYGMAEYHFLRSESVPTLGTTVFGNIQSDCTIYVPSSKLDDYKAADNWSTYANKMVGE